MNNNKKQFFIDKNKKKARTTLNLIHSVTNEKFSYILRLLPLKHSLPE